MDQPLGYIDAVRDDGRVTPLEVQTYTIVPPEHLASNIRTNLARSVPRFAGREGFGQVKEEPLAIVGAGPSLNATIEQLHGFKNVLVCGSAHDHAVRLGIVPTYALVCDGGKEDKGNLSLPQKETTYILASQCDPGLFEHLKDHRVEMWHYRGQATPSLDAERELLCGEPSLAWGSTVTVVAISIARLLGYQHLHLFGFDSSYGDYGMSHHCCKIAGSLEYKKLPAKIGEKTFISDLGLLEQANQFFRIVEAQGEFFHSTLYGDGLIAEMVRQGDPALSNYVSLA